MKTLAMIRHAKSSWTSGIRADKLRPLNDRGLRDAPLMALKLRGLLPTIQHLAVSSATRTIETAQHFRKIYNDDIHVYREYDGLYHGMPQDYETVLYTLDDAVGTVAMIGHNPGMTIMANMAGGNVDIDNVATCGIFILQSPVTKWTDFSWGTSTLKNYLYPKMYV